MVDSRRRVLLPIFVILLTVIALGELSRSTSAHAELLSADPPPDGLVLASPSQLHLTFTEPIESNGSVSIVDDHGQSLSSSMGGVQDRSLFVNIGSLDTGTYTVTWAVQSTTDGHQLSGSYSFRVGGGLPAGRATVEGENPAAWAVAARWLAFAGAAVVLGTLLFSIAVVGGTPSSSWWPRLRSRMLLGGTTVALVASLFEPVGQVLTATNGQEISIGGAVRGLPAAWWWRPGSLIPLLLLCLAITYPLRTRVSHVTAALGSVLTLGSLLGLALTSHAAGRQSWKGIAVASDFVHQATTAIWCGGLIAYVGWHIATTDDEQSNATQVLSRFSRYALVTFVIAIVTGLTNAGFVLPIVDQIWTDGLTWDNVKDLARSGYGLVLVIKIAVLAVPFALAVIHRQRARDAVRSGTTTVGRMFSRTLPLEAIVVLLVVLGGSTLALSAPPTLEQPFLDDITLVAPIATRSGAAPGLGHLTVDPVQLGDNRLSLYLTDWNGTRIGTAPIPRISLDFASLDHNVTKTGVSIQPDAGESGTWSGSGLDLSIDGWWRITARIETPDAEPASAAFYVLVDDPNTHTSDAPPKSSTDPAAQAVFDRGLARFASWQQVRWREMLGSGQDVLVIADFAVTVSNGTTPNAQQTQVAYSGAFQSANGRPVTAPTTNSRNSITIGDRAWLNTGNNTWLEENPSRFEVPSAWNKTYAGAARIRLGAVEEVAGRQAQIVTFYSPDRKGSATIRGQSEAWFVWWVDVETGDVLRVAMIARLHYMVWEYRDINTGFTIDRPVP